MAIETYGENNLTANLIPSNGRAREHYWLGLASLDDLRTNTLQSAGGALVSQYSGKYLYTLLSNKMYLRDFTDPD